MNFFIEKLDRLLLPVYIGHDEGDCNCSEIGYAIPNHGKCKQGKRIVSEKFLDSNDGMFGSWQCVCGTKFEVTISLK